MQDCKIYLYGQMQALYLYKLRNCCVQAGPVLSATFGDDLQDCKLDLASHQVRLHASHRLQVHLRAGSDPIIEDCSGIGFGSLSTIDYTDFSDCCDAAELPSGDCRWQNVQDFSNPGSTEKKNWYIIE